MFVKQRTDLAIVDAIDYVVESIGMSFVEVCEACELNYEFYKDWKDEV